MHKCVLENEILRFDGEEKLVLNSIKRQEGYLEVTWQLSWEQCYDAYISVEKCHSKLSWLGIQSLIFEEADQYENIPYLWYSTIESLPEVIRSEPYPISQEFQWISVHSNSAIMNFFERSNMCINSSAVNFVTTYPSIKSEWKFGVGLSNGELVGIVLAYPVSMNFGGVSITCVSPTITFFRGYNKKRLWYKVIKELQRRANIYHINQFICTGVTSSRTLFRCLTTMTVWNYTFKHSTKLAMQNFYPVTPGWRRMTLGDIPSVQALISYHSSHFNVRQLFTTEEEVAHHFICPAVPNYVCTYVVQKDENTITDLVSYHQIIKENKLIAHITTVISTNSPVKLLIRDVLVSARQGGADLATIFQYNLSNLVLETLGFNRDRSAPNPKMYLFNFEHPEISQKDCLYFS